MKLPFDENLSRRLVGAVEYLYPDSKHVSDVGLMRAGDETVWRHALEHGFTLVSKDADLDERSLSGALENPARAALSIRLPAQLATLTTDGNICRWARSGGGTTSSSPGRETTTPATCTSTRTEARGEVGLGGLAAHEG